MAKIIRPGTPYVASIGQSARRGAQPEVVIRFHGPPEAQEEACRRWADVYGAGFQGLDVIRLAPQMLQLLRYAAAGNVSQVEIRALLAEVEPLPLDAERAGGGE